MAKLYEENKEFLSKYKKQHEEKITNLLEENKELIDTMKTKASSFDQMMEKTVCDAIWLFWLLWLVKWCNMIIFLIDNFLPLLNHSVENTFLQKKPNVFK